MSNVLDHLVAQTMVGDLTIDQVTRFMMTLTTRLGKANLQARLREAWTPEWESGPVLGFVTVYLLTVCEQLGPDRVSMLIDAAKPGPGDEGTPNVRAPNSCHH